MENPQDVSTTDLNRNLKKKKKKKWSAHSWGEYAIKIGT
jgi:hypothetical protein